MVLARDVCSYKTAEYLKKREKSYKEFVYYISRLKKTEIKLNKQK